MSDTQNTITTKVVVDTTQAQQEVIKLNSVASDATKTLQERIDAKNKAAKIQNELAEDTITKLEEEKKLLEAIGASEKDLTVATEKLNKARIAATKESAANEKALNALNAASIKEEEALKKKKVVYEAAEDSLVAMRNELSDLTKQYDAASAEGREKLLPQITELKGRLDEATEASGRFQHNVGNYPETMGAFTSGLEAADQASGGLLTSMKALAMNPLMLAITAIVGVFALLKQAMDRNAKATESINKIMAVFSGIIDGVLNALGPVVEFLTGKLEQAFDNPKQAIIDFGNAIKENLINRVKSFMVLGEAVKEFLSGNFSEGAKKAADGFIQMGTGVENATDKIAAAGSKLAEFAKNAVDGAKKAIDINKKLANSERELFRIGKEFELQQLTFQKNAELQRQLRDEEARGIAARMESNKELGKILDAQAAKEMSMAQRQLEIAEMRKQIDGDTMETEGAIYDARIKIAEINERIASQRSEQLANHNALLKEQQALDEEAAAKKKAEEEEKAKKDKEKADAEKKAKEEALKREYEADIEKDELDIERRRLHGENVLQLELDLLEKRKQQELSNLELTEQERLNIIQKYANQAESIKQTETQAKIAADKNFTKNAISGAAEAFGVSKQVALAQMVIAAPEAIGQSFKTAAATYPFPLSLAMGALGAAGTVAPIISGISQLKSTNVSSSGATSTPSTAASAPAAAVSSVSGGAVASITSIAANNAARVGVDPSISGNATQNAAASVSGSASSKVVFSEAAYDEFKRQVAFKEANTTI